jgi:RNA polymerase sigma-70 factor (ECF subfamily)
MVSKNCRESSLGQAEEEEQLRSLMVRYQAGDSASLDLLIERLSPKLFRFFSGARVTKSDAEDLFQDCWMRIHRSRHTYRASEPILPWIFAIARYTQLDWYRHRKRLSDRETISATVVEHVGVPANPEPAPDWDFYRLLEHLPEGQQEVLILMKVSGMSLEEVALATSSTVGAVKQKAHRAYETLRRVLGKQR